MKKLSKLTLRCVSFAMAAMMTATGFLDNLSISSNKITGNLSGSVAAEAATTGTVSADTFSWDNASVYFLLTDRFKNGDTSNDHSYNRGLDANGNLVQGVDDRATFHGGDFAGVTQSIEEGYFDNLGVNALWISAPYEQIHGYIVGGDGSPSFSHYSYHGYYVLDYTNSDANFGTMEEFKTLVDTAHKHGIRVVMDIVLNHAGYNSLYDMKEYGFGSVKTGWDSYYYSMQNVNNKDYHSYIDYEADESAWAKWWGPGWIRAGLPGYTEGGSDNYTMSLAGLPDFKTESTATVGIPTFLTAKWKQEGRYDEEVAELKSYLSKNGYAMTVTNCISYWLSTWVRDYGVDGFRCDTAKHVELSSWKTLNTMCTEALKTWKANNPTKKLDDLDFWMTGECWDHKVSYDGYYTEANFDSMLNFETIGGGALAEGTIESFYERYATSINSKSDFNVLSFMSSHDSALAGSDRIYLGSAFLLLPGGIQMYYGDETNRPLVDGIPYDGNGGAGHSLRSDMNWDSMDETVLAHWQKVGTFRNNHIAVGAGTNTTVTTTSGHAFTRTYASGDVKDRVAFCIAAAANTDVTIDVSNVWSDGDSVVNYYDSSSAVVKNGKVTFNSGANGTILIQDPDGKPLVTIKGDAKFKGTQTVTVSLKETEQAIVSVDGAKKFIVKDGDTFTVGNTAYEGDTVTVTYQATNDKGTVNGKATFYKAYANEDISDKPVVKEDGIIHVKMSDGSAPYLYAWSGTKTALTAVWPGTQLTEKDADGYYVYDLGTQDNYSVIFNGGSGKAKTDDITGLSGKTYFTVDSSYASYTQVGVDTPIVNNTVTIHVKPYGTTAPYAYIWNGSKTYNGGFPGKQLTEKDSEGWYTFTQEGTTTLNCVIGNGNATERTGDITGIAGEAWITITSADSTKYTIEKAPVIESKFALLKKEARAIKNMTISDYTADTWNKLYSYVAGADLLIAQGEEKADTTAVTTMYNNIVAAKTALVIAKPNITNAVAGSAAITGKAAYGADVTLTINGKKYTATSDEITGIWTVTSNVAVKSTDMIYVTAARAGLTSEQLSYDMSAGPVDPPTDELTASLKVNGSSVSTTANLGSTVTLSASAAGGSGSYTYKFVMKTSTGLSITLKDYSSGTSYTGPLTTAGTKIFTLYVKDSAGTVTQSSNISLVVSGDTQTLKASLKVNNSTSTVNANVGGTVTLAAGATGGSGSYTYKYVMKTSSGATVILKDYSTAATYTGPLTTAGTKAFTVYVKDSVGTVATSSTINVVVSNAQELKASLKVNGSTSTVNANVGGTVTLAASATGGRGSYTYKYVMKNISTGSTITLKNYSSATSYTGPLTTAGTKEFTVYVKDSNGTVAVSSTIRVVVTNTKGLTAELKVNNTSNQINASVGDTITYKVEAAGGSGTYTYRFVVKNLKTGIEYVIKDYSANRIYTGELAGKGSKELKVYVKDSDGTVVTTNVVKVVVS